MQNNCITFQSTPSAWRETCRHRQDRCCQRISIHSLRMEGDCRIRRFFLLCDISIHSLRMEGDVRWVAAPGRFGNISIHSLRMEGDLNTKTYIRSVGISIHSLRMEGDRFRRSSVKYDSISIHSLRMEGDQSILFRITSSGSFQSTPSAWRETTADKI